MNKQKFISVWLLLMLVTSFTIIPASASILDDTSEWINANLRQLSLTLPSVGTINVACESGATCNLAGDNWNVEMLVTSSASKPNIKLNLQSGINRIDSSGNEWVTEGSVLVSLLDKGATMNVPTSQLSNGGCSGSYKVPEFLFDVCDRNSYYIWQSGGVTANVYQLPVYEPTQFSNVITTHYTISVDSSTGNLGNQDVNYNYLSPATVIFTDNQGNHATISPKYQTNQGVNAEVSGRVFVDNGYGTYYLFNENSFSNALWEVFHEQTNCGFWSSVSCASTWADWYTQILTKTSPVGMANSATISAKSGNNMVISYPPGSIGTQVQAVISKNMAKTVQVIQSYGIPRIDSVVTTSAVKGSTKSTVTVKVTNTNTAGSDNFQVTLNSASYGFNVRVVSSPVGNILSGGKQGMWVFELDPTGITTSNTVNMIATATSSGGQDTKSFGVTVTVPSPSDINQYIYISTINSDGVSSLSNAPIFVGSTQVGIGYVEYKGIVGQTYVIETNNNSNPTLFAPTKQIITLNGGAPIVVKLYFTTTPPSEIIDLTWLFWLGLIIACLLIIYYTGLYKYIIRFIMTIIASPIGISLLLYGVLAIIVILLLWGIYNSIVNFKLF